jgi:hypothetical protein
VYFAFFVLAQLLLAADAPSVVPDFAQAPVYERQNGGTLTLTLASAPKAGNTLLILGEGKDGVPGIPGFNQRFYDGAQSFQGAWAYTRTVLGGDSPNITIDLREINGFANVALIELDHADRLNFAHGTPSISGRVSTGIAPTTAAPETTAIALAMFEADDSITSAPVVASGWTLLHAFGVSSGANHVAALAKSTSSFSSSASLSAPSMMWPRIPDLPIAMTVTIISEHH